LARGWESKSVELQQSDSLGTPIPPRGPSPASDEELARERELDGLRSSVVRVTADLARATHPRYREQLSQALAFLEEKIRKLTEGQH